MAQIRKTCIIIFGPTAVGKSDFAFRLADGLKTSIISMDSRQCYKELNIGVAKPSDSMLEHVSHYFVNSHSIHTEINVKIFQDYCNQKLQEIFDYNDYAVLVGGTGFYIDALLNGISNLPEVSMATKQYVKEHYEKSGSSWLQSEVKKLDPIFFAQADINNTHRMLRALEIILSGNLSILKYKPYKPILQSYQCVFINLQMPRHILYDRINSRVLEMMKMGLLSEVENLYAYKHLKALQSIGYKELFAHLDNEFSLDFAVQKIQQYSRNYAKRQLTWFKKYPDAKSINMTSEANINLAFEYIYEQLV